MKPILMIGSTVVTLALIAYSIAIITEQRKHLITSLVLKFLTIGVILDITATTCMIIGSSNTPFTIHGFLGYSALTAMIIDAVLLWKFRRKQGIDSKPSKNVHLYSRYAYAWWVIAYITGSLLVILK